MDNNTSSGPPERSPLHSSHQNRLSNFNGNSPRPRPQTLTPPRDQKNVGVPLSTLVLIINKDDNGYGMKVSGDKPVFVESVKAGGAAQKAGLVADDMILKVNGTSVRSSTHTNVVELIKASENVELTVQRSHNKMQRPTSANTSITPTTPVPQRNSITAPLPVDHAKRREMEFSKIQTLRLMLDEEQKNLDTLNASSSNNRQKIPDITRAEANIKKLKEQLKQICGEDTSYLLFQSANISPLFQQPPSQNTSTPAFLSRFPRSLSSLSLGTKKKSADKDTSPNISVHTDCASPTTLNQSGSVMNVSTPNKKKHGSDRHNKSDIPPPLPQRNIPKKLNDASDAVDMNIRKNTVVSDLDHSILTSSVQHKNINNNNSSSKSKKKAKTKTMSDPKMDTSMFLHMERNSNEMQGEPPPLPPRQPGLMEVNQNNILNNDTVFNNNRNMSGTDINGRPLPNSINTLMNYPLITTCTTVRDNMSAAFPLSQRPNIVHHLQRHQETTALNSQPTHINQSLNKKHRRIVSSPENINAKDYEHPSHRHHKTSSESWDKRNEITPPGTPPPPYLSGLSGSHHESSNNDMAIASPVVTPNQTITAAQTNLLQKPIISMEDDEISDQESFIEEHGPFKSLSQLLETENTAHLAVFLNFVLSNSDPSPLLFYLITALYKEGSVKDMRKWAYEIHSTFLVPRAPLLWSNVDESLAREIDDVLQNEYDKGEILRKIFWKSRIKAKDFINTQLQEFQIKRTAGLGTMYGPLDHILQEAKGDKLKEQRIVEETLLPKLQTYLDEIEKEIPNECPKKSALCSALSTVLQRFFVTRSNPGSPIDKVHHFVSREKSFKNRLMGKNRKQNILGHNLHLQPYYEVTHCNHCQNILWGVSPQGYHCSNCDLNIHRTCSKVLEEYCPGPTPIKTDSKITKLMDKIRTTHHSATERTRRQDEDGFDDTLLGDRSGNLIVRQPSDRRQDISSGSYAGNNSATSDYLGTSSTDGDTFPQGTDKDNFRDSVKSKSAPVSVNRSESYKERSQKRTRNTRRKTSDPSLTKTTDEQNESSALINNYSSSSTSSLPLGLDSRSTSLEAVGVPQPAVAVTTIQTAPLFLTSTASSIPTAREWIDSEDEGPGDLEADWSSNVAQDILATLSDAEKKRQEVINEIYQTERNHVRTLKLLEGIFMRPLQESGALSIDHLQLLFPSSLLTLKDLHSSFESKLKQRRLEHCSLVTEIGDLLLSMFDGKTGEDLKEQAAHFCARQQIALEALKEKRKKDENVQRLLIKAESHKACRRLQLKDLLPTALQRLTKYPLLFDSLYKLTVRVKPDNEIEAHAIKRALESSKRILDHVNQAVRIEEDAHKLLTIQRKLDKSGLEKDAPSEFKNIDLTLHKLVHDGPLIIKDKKNTGVQLHGLLFDSMMVLLQKQDEKYLLKYHSSPCLGSGESKSIEGRFHPITKINLILVRQSAVDKNTFFLINTNVSQMLELTAPSSSECKTWFKHISDAADAYKLRTKGTQDFNEDASNHPPKDTFEAVTETPKIEQTPTPIDRLDLKDSHKFKANDESQDKERSGPENEENLKNEEKDNLKNCQLENRDCNGNSDEEKDEYPIESSSNNTRTLTQQCSLVAPSEIQICLNATMTAEPILTPTEQLRRLDVSIRQTLVEKQKVVCDMFKVPDEHFQAIADIAGQPEAPKEPTDMILAAFAHIQSLTEVLNDYMRVTQQQQISAVSTSTCDECNTRNINTTTNNQNLDKNENSNKELTMILVDQINITEDEHGYCEIDELRASASMRESQIDVENSAKTSGFSESKPDVVNDEELKDDSHIEINDDYDTSQNHSSPIYHGDLCGRNRLLHASSLVPTVPCHLIASYVSGINSQISQLLPKISERDLEREQLRRENQHLRELLNAMHHERVLESEETFDEPANEVEQSPENVNE